MFTIAQAITRLTAGQHNLFKTQYGTMTAPQQLARINEILDRWYESGSWRGVLVPDVALTSSGGIVSLPAAYLWVDKRIVITTDGHEGCYYETKPLTYRYQPNGPGYCVGCLGVAVDLGDNGSGVRQYRLTYDPDHYAAVDALAYAAVLRKRYVWATDTTPTVIPDCYAALVLSARAMAAEDEQAVGPAADYWAQAYAVLDSNLGQFEEGNDLGVMPIDPLCAAPGYNAI